MSGVGSKQPLLGAVRCYPEISGVRCWEPPENIILLTTDFLLRDQLGIQSSKLENWQEVRYRTVVIFFIFDSFVFLDD